MTSPVALMSAGGGNLAQPGDAGADGKPVKVRPKLEKASLSLYDPAPANGGSSPGAKRGAIAFQFNPKEVTIAKTANWKRNPATLAKKAGPAQFIGAEP